MIGHKVVLTATRGWIFAVTISSVMAMAAFGAALHNHSAAAANINATQSVKMFQPVKPLPIGKITSQVLATPLEPNLLHGLIAHRVSKRGATVLSAPERAALESLGWQSTVVQVDLIQDGIARADEAAALTRIDGLLRRRKLMPQFIGILGQIEQTGSDARAKLVTMLLANPNWRRDFLGASVGMTTNTAVLARSATLGDMAARGLVPRREEVAPIVNALEAIGESARAEALWRKFQKIGRIAPLPFDPKFVGMASNPLDGRYQTMAYEWRPGEGTGYSVQASSVGSGSAALKITWDGRGAPVLLQQKLITPPGRFTVTVRGDLLDRSTLQRIAFVFYCNGANPVFYDRISQNQDGGFVFGADESVNCENPELKVVGMSDENTSSVELELDSILIARKIASDN